MSTYCLYLDGVKTIYSVEGKSPTKALVELCQEADLLLFEQDGRYGKAHVRNARGGWEFTARPVMALTMPWTRRKLDPQERTTRV